MMSNTLLFATRFSLGSLMFLYFFYMTVAHNEPAGTTAVAVSWIMRLGMPILTIACLLSFFRPFGAKSRRDDTPGHGAGGSMSEKDIEALISQYASGTNDRLDARSSPQAGPPGGIERRKASSDRRSGFGRRTA